MSGDWGEGLHFHAGHVAGLVALIGESRGAGIDPGADLVDDLEQIAVRMDHHGMLHVEHDYLGAKSPGGRPLMTGSKHPVPPRHYPSGGR